MLEVMLGMIAAGTGLAAYLSQKRTERLAPDWNGTNWLVVAPDGKIVTIESPPPPSPAPTTWQVDMQLRNMGYK